MFRNRLSLALASLAGAVVAVVGLAAVRADASQPILGAALQWVTTTNTTKSVSPKNPLPVAAYPEWSTDTTIDVTSGTSVRAGALATGTYALACNNTMFADQGDSSVVATASERRIPAGFVYPIRIDDETYVALIGTMGGGTCTFSLDLYE